MPFQIHIVEIGLGGCVFWLTIHVHHKTDTHVLTARDRSLLKTSTKEEVEKKKGKRNKHTQRIGVAAKWQNQP